MDSQADSPFYLSYHWLEADADRVVVFEGARTEFPVPVGPGVTVSVPAFLRSPREPGRYRLAWDIVQEGRLWFSTEPGAVANVSHATVTGQSVLTEMPGATRPLPRRAVRPTRFELWRAGAGMLTSHPLLGVGEPDNSGWHTALHRPRQRRSAHPHQQHVSRADRRQRSPRRHRARVAAVAPGPLHDRRGARGRRVAGPWRGLGVVAPPARAHSRFRRFVSSFTPTYILIALTLGLVVASTNEAEVPHYAHRV
jgi:hypothetical protein